MKMISQRNITMDVKNGVSEPKELLDVMQTTKLTKKLNSPPLKEQLSLPRRNLEKRK